MDAASVTAVAATLPLDGEELGKALDRILTQAVIDRLVAEGIIDGGSAA